MMKCYLQNIKFEKCHEQTDVKNLEEDAVGCFKDCSEMRLNSLNMTMENHGINGL